MSYFEAFVWLMNKGWKRSELDSMKISEIKKLAESKTKAPN
jgi:hypothetical protein